jgi:hypothetical protein
MALKHLKLPTAEVENPGGNFTVRGLSFVDITALVGLHQAELSALFDQIKVGEGKLDIEDPSAMLSGLMAQAPEAAAQIIALAADEPDVAIAVTLPFPVQLDALEKIVGMTFAAEGGAKKVLETIIRVATGAAAAIKGLRA